MIEPREYTYEEFPASPEESEGMKKLETSREEMGVVYINDVIYREKDGLRLTLQILKPVFAHEDETRYPCIAFVQGSGWMKQNVHCNVPVLADLAKRGFVTATIEYRPSETAVFPAQIIDAKAAVRFLRKHAAEYNIDPEKMVIFGDSSGGHTSLMVNITHGMAEFEPEEDSECSDAVSCCIDYYGPTDLLKMNDAPSACAHLTIDSPEGILIGKLAPLENVEKTKALCPMSYTDENRDIAPVLIMHGDKDRTVPFNQSVLIYNDLKAKGKEVEFYKLLGADHGGPQFWSSRVLDIVEAFIRKNI